MTTAPVGFQCPECVAQGGKSVRRPRTVFGGEIREHGTLLTKVLIGVNVALWLFGMVFSSGSPRESLYVYFSQASGTTELSARFALIKGATGDDVPIGIVDGEVYRLLTAAFMHEEFFHIGMNMLALWILGSALEPVLGRWRFLTLYILSALGGSAVSLLAAGPYSMSLGASGAVFGLLGGLFVVMRRFGRNVSAVVVILGINVVIGFTIPGIDWRAHLGGLAAGALIAAVFAHAPRQQRTLWSVLGCVVVAAAIAGTVVAGLSP